MRANLEIQTEIEKNAPEKDPKAHELAEKHLEDLAKALLSDEKTDDELVKDHKLNRVHLGMIREFHERKLKGKKLVLSDGNMEMLKIVHGSVCGRAAKRD